MITYRTAITGFFGTVLLCLSGCASQRVSEHKEPEYTLQYTNSEHLLDATSFEYFYEDGSGLSISFYKGMLRYEWIIGPRKGNQAKDIPYQSRMIGDDFYMVNWHEKKKPDFVTLTIDLKRNLLYSAAILRYGTSNEMIHFKEAEIGRVIRPAE